MGNVMNEQVWMAKALVLAQHAESAGEVPVGAIVVLDNQIIGKGFNSPIARHDPTAHAEIMALRSAARKMRNYRLTGAILYVTLEPCPMCFSAMTHARIKCCVFGAGDPKKSLNLTNHTVELSGGVMSQECGQILKQFFKERR